MNNVNCILGDGDDNGNGPNGISILAMCYK
jgi:hypothetical protein